MYKIEIDAPSTPEYDWLRDLHQKTLTRLKREFPGKVWIDTLYHEQDGSSVDRLWMDLPQFEVTVQITLFMMSVAAHVSKTQFGLPWELERLDFDDGSHEYGCTLGKGFEVTLSQGSGGVAFSLNDFWYDHAPPDEPALVERYRAANPDDLNLDAYFAS